MIDEATKARARACVEALEATCSSYGFSLTHEADGFHLLVCSPHETAIDGTFVIDKIDLDGTVTSEML